jgi:hypothetical protein
MSALSATISLSASSVYINKNVVATVTITNSAAGAINMLSINGYAYSTGDKPSHPYPMAIGTVPLLAGENIIAVPGSGSQTFQFTIIPFASSGSNTIQVGCYCLSQDGEVFQPTEVTLTALPYPIPENSNI